MNSEETIRQNVRQRYGSIAVADDRTGKGQELSSCKCGNLDPGQVFKEAFRVLKPGGRLAVSDILALKPLPDSVREDLNMVSACIGGAATVEETRQMLKSAGFKEISVTPKPIPRELMEAYLPGSEAGDYAAPADITAVKPNV